MKNKVRTHSFNGVNYRIEYASEIEGVFDPQNKEIIILRNKKRPIKELASILEEGLHAMDVPDKCLHKSEKSVKKGKSLSKVEDLARLVLRLGYKRK